MPVRIELTHDADPTRHPAPWYWFIVVTVELTVNVTELVIAGCWSASAEIAMTDAMRTIAAMSDRLFAVQEVTCPYVLHPGPLRTASTDAPGVGRHGSTRDANPDGSPRGV